MGERHQAFTGRQLSFGCGIVVVGQFGLTQPRPDLTLGKTVPRILRMTIDGDTNGLNSQLIGVGRRPIVGGVVAKLSDDQMLTLLSH